MKVWKRFNTVLKKKAYQIRNQSFLNKLNIHVKHTKCAFGIVNCKGQTPQKYTLCIICWCRRSIILISSYSMIVCVIFMSMCDYTCSSTDSFVLRIRSFLIPRTGFSFVCFCGPSFCVCVWVCVLVCVVCFWVFFPTTLVPCAMNNRAVLVIILLWFTYWWIIVKMSTHNNRTCLVTEELDSVQQRHISVGAVSSVCFQYANVI